MLLEGNRLLEGASPEGTQTELVEENVQYNDLSLVVDDNGDLGNGPICTFGLFEN